MSKTVLTVVVTAIIVGGGVYWWQNSSSVSNTEVPDNTNTQTQEPAAKLTQYQNDRLKLQFTYPAEWGTITEEDELPLAGQVTLGVQLPREVFLAADNAHREGDSGTYWGDYGVFLEDEASVMNFCDEPFAFPERVKDCEILNNANGITYAKTQEEICTEGGCTGMATNYYLFNPNSEFRGVVLSTDRLGSQYATELDELVQSLSFIE